MSYYIKRLEIVDEYDAVIIKLNHVPAETGLRDALKKIRSDEGLSSIRRIIRFLDKDAEKIFGVDDDGKNKDS